MGLLIGLLGQGHILLEGVPGLAKTLATKTLWQAVQGSFSRIVLPDTDVVGAYDLNIKANEFSIKKKVLAQFCFGR
jgi:MoxR-like ATPase